MIYAIGDIHGRFDLLLKMKALIMTDMEKYDGPHKVITLGDYIDRGPDSRRVVQMLMKDHPFGEDVEFIPLYGNHEDLMLAAMKNREGEEADIWLSNGGIQTCDSYNYWMEDKFPGDHIVWMKSLKLFHEEPGYLFVHAGIDPLRPDERDPARLLWIRKPFLESTIDYGFVVVHGHSKNPLPQLKNNRIGIDTGAYKTGILTCAAIDATDDVRFLQVKPGVLS